MIKLIASDLDGTLLDNNGNIPKEFGNIIEVLNLKNIKFAIASGRNYREAVHRFEIGRASCRERVLRLV